jgi:hypothetical protein
MWNSLGNFITLLILFGVVVVLGVAASREVAKLSEEKEVHKICDAAYSSPPNLSCYRACVKVTTIIRHNQRNNNNMMFYKEPSRMTQKTFDTCKRGYPFGREDD